MSVTMYSIQFNGVELGQYIDVLQGFTPFVGASWAPSVTELDGRINGGQFKYQKYGAKYFTMPFSMEEDAAMTLKQKYDALQRALNVSVPSRLIFEGTLDRYCLAIPSGTLEFDQILETGEGVITWVVPDGVAYAAEESVYEGEVNPSTGVLEIEILNNGSANAPISYEITHSHENGYIGIVSPGGVTQLGVIDEVDAVAKQRSEELFRFLQPSDYNQMTNGQGILTENFPKNGTWGTISAEGKQWLYLADQGSGSSWHGASKYMILPADSSGSTSAKNFFCQTKSWFETGRTNQTGLVEFVIGDEEGKHLASIHLIKKSTNANIAEVIFQVMGVEKGRYEFEPSNKGPSTNDGGQMYIQKSGADFKFYFAGEHPYRVPEAAEKKAHSVTIFLGQQDSGNELITRMYFDYIFFRKDNVTYFSDIPNRYQPGDVVVIDGETTKIYTNGVPSQLDEVRGSKYPSAPPGESTVEIYYSSFCDPPPTVKAKIREVYL